MTSERRSRSATPETDVRELAGPELAGGVGAVLELGVRACFASNDGERAQHMERGGELCGSEGEEVLGRRARAAERFFKIPKPHGKGVRAVDRGPLFDPLSAFHMHPTHFSSSNRDDVPSEITFQYTVHIAFHGKRLSSEIDVALT
jgi:hypothetical protein